MMFGATFRFNRKVLLYILPLLLPGLLILCLRLASWYADDHLQLLREQNGDKRLVLISDTAVESSGDFATTVFAASGDISDAEGNNLIYSEVDQNDNVSHGLSTKKQNGYVAQIVNKDRQLAETSVTQLRNLIRGNKSHLCDVREEFVSEPTFQYLMLPHTGRCRSSGGGTDDDDKLFLIVVHSKYDHFSHRTVIRESWGAISRYMNVTTELRFITGWPSAGNVDEIARKLRAEGDRYGDLVQGNFWDSYYNLTLKQLVALRYQQSYCNNAVWLIKVDDDVFIDLYTIIEYITVRHPVEDVFCGVLGKSEPVLRGGKWKLSPDVYRQRRFPCYCHGHLIVYRGDLVSRVLTTAGSTPCHVWLDDVYVSGILVALAGGRHSPDMLRSPWVARTLVGERLRQWFTEPLYLYNLLLQGPGGADTPGAPQATITSADMVLNLWGKWKQWRRNGAKSNPDV